MSFSNHSFSRSFISCSEGIYQNLYVSGVFVVVFRETNVDLIQMVGKKTHVGSIAINERHGKTKN